MRFNVRVPMRDGITLSADIYRPSAPGRYPVILVRTPYTKQLGPYSKTAPWWVEHGYVFLIEDVRGRGDSAGEFYPLLTEAQDGFDTQSWIASQPWCSGKIGTIGGSYLGWTQVYAAGLHHPALAAMMPAVTAPDPTRNFPLWHGVILPAAAPWLAGLDGHTQQDTSMLDMAAVFHHLPLIDLDRQLGRDLPAWRDWVLHPTSGGDYWQRLSYQDAYLDSAAPALNVSGWYDDVLVGTTENFINMTSHARNPVARQGQWLLIGPWGHAINAGRKLGDIDFGASAVIDWDALQLRWFDHWLKGIDNGLQKDPHVRIFVMGANTWIDADTWPLRRARYTRYYLHSAGKANGLSGNGELSTRIPAREPPDRYRYDPADPVPFVTDLSWRQSGGPDDYRSVEARKDLLVYTTEPMKTALRICGPLTVKLFAATSARDTDWTAMVLDVHPDGYAQRLNDGIIRARFRRGDDHEELLKPGKVESYDIDTWSTCTDLLPGHRLRLQIASSAAGKFAPNLNTGGPLGQESAGVVADQSVHHDSRQASYVLLPIIPP